MSKSSGASWQAIEAAPPRLRIERRLSLDKRLETIEEESEVGHSHSYSNKPPAFESSSKANSYPRLKQPSMGAG
ncbi:unnamed protein product [Camellia sinensis]